MAFNYPAPPPAQVSKAASSGINFSSGSPLVTESRPLMPVHLLTAYVNNRTVAFPSVQEKFNALVSEWKRLRATGLSTDSTMNDAYGQIVAMGWPVVGLLLKEVDKQTGHWFDALMWITGVELVTPEMRGNIREIRKVWLNWGEERGIYRRTTNRPMAR